MSEFPVERLLNTNVVLLIFVPGCNSLLPAWQLQEVGIVAWSWRSSSSAPLGGWLEGSGQNRVLGSLPFGHTWTTWPLSPLPILGPGDFWPRWRSSPANPGVFQLWIGSWNSTVSTSMRSLYQLWQRNNQESWTMVWCFCQGHSRSGPDKGRHQQRPKDHRQDLSAQQVKASDCSLAFSLALCGRWKSMTSHSIRLTSWNGWSALLPPQVHYQFSTVWERSPGATGVQPHWQVQVL